jgi:hypothetical protein
MCSHRKEWKDVRSRHAVTRNTVCDMQPAPHVSTRQEKTPLDIAISEFRKKKEVRVRENKKSHQENEEE